MSPLDRFLFGQWLAQGRQIVHLLGASIGAWRLAAACTGTARPPHLDNVVLLSIAGRSTPRRWG